MRKDNIPTNRFAKTGSASEEDKKNPPATQRDLNKQERIIFLSPKEPSHSVAAKYV